MDSWELCITLGVDRLDPKPLSLRKEKTRALFHCCVAWVTGLCELDAGCHAVPRVSTQTRHGVRRAKQEPAKGQTT